MLISPASLTSPEAYKLLTGIVVPRPIAWVTSRSSTGVINAAPFSFYTVVSNNPPMVGVNIGRRAGQRKDTANNIQELKEFVVHVATEDLLTPMHDSSAEYEADSSEVELLGLETLNSEAISVPRLAAAPISMECRLHSILPFGQGGSEFYVGEVLNFHVRDDLIQNSKIDTNKLRPICRLAGPTYATLGEIITMSPAKKVERSAVE